MGKFALFAAEHAMNIVEEARKKHDCEKCEKCGSDVHVNGIYEDFSISMMCIGCGNETIIKRHDNDWQKK